MKLILGLAALLAGSTSPYDDGYPPLRFQGDATATVEFTYDVHPSCGKDPPGKRLEACQSGPRITLPNPCDPAFKGEAFARLSCHELGHFNGWPGDHPRP
jgi:hypothetical protein